MDSARCPIDGKTDTSESLSAVAAREFTAGRIRYPLPPVQAEPRMMARVTYFIRTYWLGGIAILGLGAAAWSSVPVTPRLRWVVDNPGLARALVVIVTVLVLAWFFYSRAGRLNYDPGLDEWQAQRRVWLRLMYCSRHEIVFDPETGQSFDPKETSEYLIRIRSSR
jgi:hypothetical protein